MSRKHYIFDLVTSFLRRLLWFLPIWYKPTYGIGVYKDTERDGKWIYCYDEEGHLTGMCLTDFDTDTENEWPEDSVVVLGKIEEK